MASIQRRRETFQYTVSHTINGKTHQTRKGRFKTRREAKEAALPIETDARYSPIAYKVSGI